MTTTVRATRRDATANRAALLDAAREALRRDPAASLETIAAQAGLSRRAFYGHFASREDLVAELVTSAAERIGAIVSTVDDPDPRRAIAMLGAAMWDEIEHIRALAQVAVRGPHRESVARALAPVRSRLRRSVDRGRAAGLVREDMPALRVAGLVEGAAIAVLDEATSSGLSAHEGRRLVMLATLGAAGLSWTEADAIVEGLR